MPENGRDEGSITGDPLAGAGADGPAASWPSRFNAWGFVRRRGIARCVVEIGDRTGGVAAGNWLLAILDGRAFALVC